MGRRDASMLGAPASDQPQATSGMLHWPANDTALSTARGGNLMNTIAAYRAMASTYGAPAVSNMWVGGGGRGFGCGDHQAGRAWDLVGSQSLLSSWASATNALGGFAQMHGSGPTRHLHWVPPTGVAGPSPASVPLHRRLIAGDTFAPARVGALAAGGPISVTVNVAGTNLTPSDIEAAAVRGVERAVRNARERG